MASSHPSLSKTVYTAKAVAEILYISTASVYEKNHYFEVDGQRRIRRDAVEHYIAGGTPQQFIERVIADGEKGGYSKDDSDAMQLLAEQWRAAWSD